MSPDNEQPVEPSVSSEREGCQDWRRQPGLPGNCPMAATPVNTTAGSAGAERATRETWLRDESCGGGRQSPTASASGSTASLEPAGAAVGAAHSSDEGGNDAGAKGPHLVEGNSAGEDEVIAAAGWLKTPPKVRQLQRTLYRKAKENKAWRAWSLYGILARRDVLETALVAVLRNGGVAGVDGVTVEQVKGDREVFLETLQRQLGEKSYRPSPVLRGWVPKKDGKPRPLGIPTVKDRIVQMALLLLLQPIFEADFHDNSYGYRPGKSAQQALDAIREAIRQGYHEVIDADLSGYFDTINHAALLKLVARRVSDGSILKLVKQFLQAPIVERAGGKQRITPNKTGTPQGGVISPLLANLYLDSLDHQANEPQTKAKMVRYADDFVLLCRPGQTPALRGRLEKYLQAKGLKLNPTKTRLLDAHQDRFRFLGFEVSWRQAATTRYYAHVEPSGKSQTALRDKVRDELNRWTRWESCAAKVCRLNAILRGWGGYFHYSHCTRVFRRVQHWVQERLRTWLWQKYDRTHSRYGFFTNARLVGQYGLYQLPLHAPWQPTAQR
jgi:group II intron reverse transcriptase/maturase